MAASTGKTKVTYGPHLDPAEPQTFTGSGGGGRSGMFAGIGYNPNAGRAEPRFSVGRVGTRTQSAVVPGKAPGSGVGVRGKFVFKKGGDVKGKEKPVKKAAGGAAKVRKGSCSPDGKIINAMRKLRG